LTRPSSERRATLERCSSATIVALVTIVAYAVVACAPVTSLQFTAAPLADVTGNGQWARFDMMDGTQVEMKVLSVQFPIVSGLQGGQQVVLDLRRVKSFAVGSEHRDEATSTIKYARNASGIYAAILFGVALIVLATKSSCPFFYMEDGDHLRLVGEAYSGAAFRSLGRDDLLPTPLPEGPRARARLANEAHETQFTDRLDLAIVDHSPDVRVVSTFDAHAIAVGPTRPPSQVRDQDGRDVGGLLLAVDNQIWQTDLAEMAARTAPPSRESLELRFDPGDSRWAPTLSNGIPVLELVLANTYWVDAVMGRFFALMGSRLEGFIETGNDPAARGNINAWREREGIDLRVEVEVGGAFRPVTVIPTVGPMALRRVAVPLPREAARDGRPIRVRVSGGLGFWRIDEGSLSSQMPLDVEVRRIAPVWARDPAGRDWRATLRATDGDSHVLGDRGDRLDLSFDLPPVPNGRHRTAFLFTHGYYNVHRPPQGDFSPLVLRTIRDQSGALAAFGLQLFRGYERRLLAERVYP
jgi:hypothetical protein